ncbi:hypothetical protein AWB69_01080 [Caballeronia udeis]|uniref:Uncharacterized protein n=1 Tax=Caballeronia udeis TaxID=1232866 RepID=A0A158FGI3_9BURK|nr:hypothetical protein AWB69_01080 [Caballeronia udeis]
MRCDLYSTGTDSRIISCTVWGGLWRGMRHAASEIRHRNPGIIGTIHSLANAFLHRLDRFKNTFENSLKQGGSMNTEASFNRTAFATAFGMLIVLVC